MKLKDILKKEKNKDFRNKECCLTCECFQWWDGDYCCLGKLEIIHNSDNGYMTEDIDHNLVLANECEEYIKTNERHYVEQYEKHKKLEDLINEMRSFIKH